MNIVGERVVIRISMTILMDVRSSFFKFLREGMLSASLFSWFSKKMVVKVK